MKKFYLCLVIVVCFLGKQAYAQFTPVQWKKLYDTASSRLIYDFPIYFFASNKLVKLPNGEALFVADFNGDIGLWKVNVSGNVLWRKIFGGGGTERVNAIRQAADGGFIIVGSSTSNDALFPNAHGALDAFVAKTDQVGNVQWVRLIGGGWMDVFTHIEVVSDGYIAIGHTESNDGDILVNNGASELLICHLNMDGTVAWTKTFGGLNCERAFTALINKNEDIIVGGLVTTSSSCDLGNPIKKLLIGLNKAGVQLWQTESIIGGPGESGAITNLTFNADSSQIYSIVKKTINQQPWLYKFNSNTGAVVATQQLNFNISTDFGATTIRRKSNNNYLVSIASPVYQTSFNQPKYTYLAEINDAGNVLSLNQFDFNSGIITDVVERNNEFLLFSSQSHSSLPYQVQLGVYNPNPAPAVPVITSFSPAAASFLQTVVIKGSGFTSVNSIIFGGYAAYSFEIIDDSTIAAKVGRGGALGSVSVYNQNGYASKEGFTYLPSLPVAGFSPGYGPIGTSVRIDGNGFSGILANNHVYFGQTEATVLEAYPSYLIVTVPAGAATGEIIVTVDSLSGADSLSGYTRDLFMVILPGEDAVKSFAFDERPVLSASNAAIRSFASGDFNGDGTADLAVVSKGTTVLAVFKSISSLDSIMFEPGIEFALPGNAMDVITGDVDLDGKVDILVKTNQQNFISIFRNTSANGNTSFASRVDIAASSYPNNQDHGSLLAISDLNGDNRPELITDNPETQTFSVYKNTGSPGVIQYSSKIDFPYYPQSIVVRDFNGDNKPDVAALSSGNFFVTFRNTSEGDNISLVRDQGGLSGGMMFSFTANDYDGDGKPDLAGVTIPGRYLVIFRNTSTTNGISFAPRSEWPLAYYPNYINFGDFDSDGKGDIVIGNNSLTTFSVMRNISSAGNLAFTFKQDFKTGTNAAQSVVADINNDGKPDVATIAEDDGRIFIARNMLHEPIIQAFSPAYGASGDTITIKGLNFTGTTTVKFGGVGAASFAIENDSTLKAIVDTGATGTVSVLNTYGRGSKAGFTLGVKPAITSFLPAKGSKRTIVTIKGKNLKNTTRITFGGTAAASFAVVNDSTVNTIVDTGSTGEVAVTTLFGTDSLPGFTFGMAPVISSFTPGNGKLGDTITITGKYFVEVTDISFGGTAAASFTVVNDSTITAIVGAGATGSVRVANSYGAGGKFGFVYGMLPVITSFSPLTGPVGSTVTIRGKHFGNAISGNTVFFGAAKATITAVSDTALTVIVPPGATYKPITVTNPDSLTAWSDQRFVISFPGATDTLVAKAAFADKVSWETGGVVQDLALGDLNGDGKVDLATISYSAQEVRLYQNTSSIGAISFAPYLSFSALYARYIVIEDIDGDGKQDMILSGNNNLITIYKNVGTSGSFSFQAVYLPTIYRPSLMVVQDIDRDGKTDLAIMTSEGANGIMLYKNISHANIISFEFNGFYNTEGVIPTGLAVEDIDRDDKPDLCVKVAAGAPHNLFVFKNISQPGVFSFGAKQGYYRGGIGGGDIIPGDLDGDLFSDLAIVNSSPANMAIMHNKSSSDTIAFDTPVTINLNTSFFPSFFVIGDIDGDGKPDIAVGNRTSNTVSLLNNKSAPGVISYAAKSDIVSVTSPIDLCLGDLDGDGKPDLALINLGKDSISIFRNKVGEALVTPSGTNPVTGGMTNQVTIDATVQTYQGHPYVQRHYDITPANNPATATATITLYFTQQEFDNYNAHPAHGFDLPHHASDNLNKANLRVYQYHGFSTTSLPGSYSGNGVEIDPDDIKIVWNTTTLQWEVTFDVNGFSGFFIGTSGNSILPVTLLSFEGHVRDNVARLQWTTTREINVIHFELQRRDNNSDFVTIGKINAAGGSTPEYDYRYNDELDASPVYYYRLKIVDIDQSVTYSKTIMVKPTATNSLITLGPNPAKDYVIVKHPARNHTAQLKVVDLTGKVIKVVAVGNNTTQTKIVLKELTRGTYSIVWDEGTSTTSQVLIVQ